MFVKWALNLNSNTNTNPHPNPDPDPNSNAYTNTNTNPNTNTNTNPNPNTNPQVGLNVLGSMEKWTKKSEKKLYQISGVGRCANTKSEG